jgi:hypothetical protein
MAITEPTRGPILDTSEPDWWINGEAVPADWLVTADLLARGLDGGWVVVRFDGDRAAMLLTRIASEEFSNQGATSPDVSGVVPCPDDDTCPRADHLHFYDGSTDVY